MISDFQEARDKFEKYFIEELLIRTGGNVNRAARMCNMNRRTFHDKVKRYSLGRHSPIDTKSLCECASIPIGKIKWSCDLKKFHCKLCNKITNPKYDNYYAKTVEAKK